LLESSRFHQDISSWPSSLILTIAGKGRGLSPRLRFILADCSRKERDGEFAVNFVEIGESTVKDATNAVFRSNILVRTRGDRPEGMPDGNTR
jgi:hypothetical protein